MADHRIVIIGTGFSGLGMGIQLRRAGITDFVILEQNDDIGGTWHDNHYPGCACDVPSALYSFSFELSPDWQRIYARQPEIKAYLKHCAEKYGLLPHIRLNTRVVSARYEETDRHWQVCTADSHQFRDYQQDKGLRPGDPVDPDDPALPPLQPERCQVLIAGVGALSTPAWPDIPGLDTFAGHSFHSQRWDHDYDLTGKRVAVIGTGASAIQFVPQIAGQVARLDLYQRTPPWIVPKDDHTIGPDQQQRYRRFPTLLKLRRALVYSLLESRVTGFVGNTGILRLGEKMARHHIAQQIADEPLRRQVTPDYPFGCKRVLISNDYYPALLRPNVELIGQGLTAIRGNTLVDDTGQEREVDCVIFGTGFRAQQPIPPGMVFGRGGQDLHQAWAAGAEAYKGTTVTGFPNLFVLMGPNTGLGHSSMVYMIESQIRYVLDALQTMDRQGWRTVEVRSNEQRQFSDRVQQRLQGTVWQSGCHSWYLNDQGRNTVLWPGFTWRFRQLTRRFDAHAYNAE